MCNLPGRQSYHRTEGFPRPRLVRLLQSQEDEAMAAGDGIVVVCTYAERDGAAELIAAFRKKKIAAAVVPSTQVLGAWDVVVPARAAMPSRESLEAVLVRD